MPSAFAFSTVKPRMRSPPWTAPEQRSRFVPGRVDDRVVAAQSEALVDQDLSA